MKIDGKCHCGNLTYVLHWPDEGDTIPVRACTCTFCTKHGGTYTSHRDAELAAVVHDDGLLTRYRFGTGTAEFYVCARCGVVPFVTSELDGRVFAVVNVNSFDNVDPARFASARVDFEGESKETRLDRRKRTWISSVTITHA